MFIPGEKAQIPWHGVLCASGRRREEGPLFTTMILCVVYTQTPPPRILPRLNWHAFSLFKFIFVLFSIKTLFFPLPMPSWQGCFGGLKIDIPQGLFNQKVGGGKGRTHGVLET